MTVDKATVIGEQGEKPKEQFVHSVFESIAGKYDLMNDILSFRRHKAWRKFTMRKMGMKRGDSAVDLCCGTCDWVLLSLTRVSPGMSWGWTSAQVCWRWDGARWRRADCRTVSP